jgi:hypothetical protein
MYKYEDMRLSWKISS